MPPRSNYCSRKFELGDIIQSSYYGGAMAAVITEDDYIHVLADEKDYVACSIQTYVVRDPITKIVFLRWIKPRIMCGSTVAYDAEDRWKLLPSQELANAYKDRG